MTTVLEVKDVSGGYSYDRPVLHDLTFQVNKEEIVGLIGLNGAGKSTTIKHILGLMDPTKGDIKINNQTIYDDKTSYRANFTYIPEMPTLYDQLTLWEHLELTAMSYKVDRKIFEERAPKLLKEFRMENKVKWFPSHFSKGMRQKVMIMCALLVEPSLYVVDEPFVGLDPIGIQSFLDLMVDMKKKGAGILMSTHILSTAELYCDRFLILHDGRLVLTGTLSELREAVGNQKATLHDIYLMVAKGDIK